MYNDILDAVTRKLAELFPECTIYIDSVEQGLKEPCFFVGFLEPAEKQMIGPRYFRKAGIYIQYLPQRTDQPSREVYTVAEVLNDQMDYISLSNGDLMHGTNLKWKVSPEDTVLNFFVDYNHFAIKKAGQMEESMENVEIKSQAKGE